MKVDFLSKAKWYIVGFMLIAIMLSVSLSFCAWDTLSAKAGLASDGTGNFAEAPEDMWMRYIKGADGEFITEIPKVGDIVTYGRFYQDADAITTGETAPLRWRVVHNEENKLTLLAEKVLVYGNFWGSGVFPHNYQNDYYRSTLRSWLNSGEGSLKDDGSKYNDNNRNDGLNNGNLFGKNENQINKGFLDIAFTDGAESILVAKKITGMKYYNQQGNNIKPCELLAGSDNKTNPITINDLVWLPSFQEICGGSVDPWGNAVLDPGYSQFKYFQNNMSPANKTTGATKYAMDADRTSYYNNGGGNSNGNLPLNKTWWWLRSPAPSAFNYSLSIQEDGSASHAGTHDKMGGVRPAVCVQL